MEEYIGRKKIIVTTEKHLKLSGEISVYKKGGILNFPEEEPGTEFYVHKTDFGFVLNHIDRGGYLRCTRKSGIQTVINVGRIEDNTTEYKCFKTDFGYKFEKIELLSGVGTGKNILYLRKNNKDDLYICLPLEFIKELKAQKGDFLKITYNICDDFSITIEKATKKCQCCNTVNSRIGYVVFDGRNKSLSICRRASRYLEDIDAFAVIHQKGKLKLVKYPKFL